MPRRIPFLKLLIGACLAITGALAFAAPATLAPSQFIGGLDVDTDALGHRVPVVLVHGLGGSGDGWDALLHAYAANPSWRAVFKPYTYRYPNSATDIAAAIAADPATPRTITGLGKAFRDVLQAWLDKPATAAEQGFGGRSFVVLAHSMGGLVARSMMQEYAFRDGTRGGDHVLHLVTLGTPHQGTPLADAGFAIGLPSVPEFASSYAGFVADMAWTNYDGLDMGSGICNPWLARLNTFAPMPATRHGRCGTVGAVALPGFYEKIIAYAASSLQSPDLAFGLGVFKPGSDRAMLATYAYLHDGLSRTYANDGIVPFASAQLDGQTIWTRAEAVDCDHRYLERGYPETVRSWTATYTDWAFCGAANTGGTQPSGTAGGWAVVGSIYAAPGGIVEKIRDVAQAERLFAWAEQAYAPFLQSPGALTRIADGYYYRYYPATNAYVGVKNGDVHYMGPASGGKVIRMGTLASFLALAQAEGY
jgi:pimeloyl-ACP methyl ester carboxylesterase